MFPGCSDVIHLFLITKLMFPHLLKKKNVRLYQIKNELCSLKLLSKMAVLTVSSSS